MVIAGVIRSSSRPYGGSGNGSSLAPHGAKSRLSLVLVWRGPSDNFASGGGVGAAVSVAVGVAVGLAVALAVALAVGAGVRSRRLLVALLPPLLRRLAQPDE